MLRLSKGLLPLAACLAVVAAGPRAQAGSQDSITTHLVNLPVTDPTTQASYPTITAAAAAADAGETVRVGPGDYNESVDVTKPLTILGAQAGVPVRGSNRPQVGQESRVTAPNGSGFVLAADNIIVDGFAFNDCGIAGVTTLPGNSGYRVLNNIFGGNAVGLETASLGTNQTVIRGNLFSNNNLAGPGLHSGYGIRTNGFLTNTAIENNATVGHDMAAVSVSAAENLTITDNRFQFDTRVALANVNGASITDNLFENGDDPAGQLVFLFRNTDITVTGNRFLDNQVAAICFPQVVLTSNPRKRAAPRGKSPVSSDIHINGNDFIGNPIAIKVVNGTYAGTLDAERNYYGSDSGPQADDNPNGTGDAVSGNVDYRPWLRRSITDPGGGGGGGGGGPATDVTRRLHVYKGLPFIVPGRGIFATVTVVNRGGGTVRGPLRLAISGVTGGARVVSASGFTRLIHPPGTPFVNLTEGDLAPGESAIATVRFSGRQRDFRYRVRVFSGEPGEVVTVKSM